MDINESDPEKRVADFIKFLPVLAYDGAAMTQLNAEAILDIAMSGTSATLLARRWESALLVNVDNETLARLMANPEAMDALMRIEGFRSLNSDIETIINKSEKVKKAKTKEKDLTPKQKKELTEAEKEFKEKRKKIQEKLIKFATRVPVFMYLTDYRERCLKDVITQLEPGLFKKVTGLEVKDFELLCSLNVFNANLMNEAIFSFKRYEDSSLSYTGLDKHQNDDVGGWDTVLRRKEYERLFYSQQESMAVAESDNLYEDEADEKLPEQQGKVVSLRQLKAEKEARRIAAERQALYSAVKVGASVVHKTLGTGKVSKISKDKKYIFIRFDNSKVKNEEKPFVFSTAFEQGFLKLKNS